MLKYAQWRSIFCYFDLVNYQETDSVAPYLTEHQAVSSEESTETGSIEEEDEDDE